MAKHGFDERKLHHNLDRLFEGWVESGMLPCVQAQIIRHGETAYDKAFGWADMESKAPLQQDSIFRIYSMSKVFTSAAMLMLLEEGRYKMHDPLSKFVPEFKDARVAEYSASRQLQLVPPRREIIIRDLFTMASGIPYPGGDTASERAVQRVFDAYDANLAKGEEWDTPRFLRALSQVPLTFHPGEHWWYGYSIDVLGHLIPVLTGQSVSEFFQDRIFAPLGLVDTHMTLPEEKRGRLVTMYDVDGAGKMTRNENFDQNDGYFIPRLVQSGGGGLLSTASDVSRFAQMLLGFGASGDTRLLSRKSVELMRTNHLTPQQLADYTWDTQRGYGYGLGVRVMMHPEIAGYGSVGEFAWDGMAGTWFAVDPSEDLTAVILVQTSPGRHYQFVPQFAQAVYGAIAD